ncbi:hypothetical protein GOBAR_DD07676 [Gossypium barbadense]|nr:hypothetical protein GOBAR_DD07676 [Gossypium barbadense]
MSGSDVSGSDISGSDTVESDVSNRIRVNLDDLNMDGIEVGELCDNDDSGRLNPNDPTDQAWQIRSSNPNHICSKVYKNKNEKNPTHWSRSHFSIRSHSDILVNNLSVYFIKMILEARGKPILTMMETIRAKIMLLIVCSITCWWGRYQVECGLGSQHVVDLVENSYSCRNWDLTGIPCMHALAIIHLKDEFLETYVQTWYTKQTQLQIYSNFIRLVRGPKQLVYLSNMLPILPLTLRRPPDRPTKATIRGVAKGKLAKTFFTCSYRSKDIKLVFTTKWLPQLSNRLPQISKGVPQLNRLPQLTKKMLPQEKSSHSRGNQPLLDGCLLLKSHL